MTETFSLACSELDCVYQVCANTPLSRGITTFAFGRLRLTSLRYGHTAVRLYAVVQPTNRACAGAAVIACGYPSGSANPPNHSRTRNDHVYVCRLRLRPCCARMLPLAWMFSASSITKPLLDHSVAAIDFACPSLDQRTPEMRKDTMIEDCCCRCGSVWVGVSRCESCVLAGASGGAESPEDVRKKIAAAVSAVPTILPAAAARPLKPVP